MTTISEAALDHFGTAVFRLSIPLLWARIDLEVMRIKAAAGGPDAPHGYELSLHFWRNPQR